MRFQLPGLAFVNTWLFNPTPFIWITKRRYDTILSNNSPLNSLLKIKEKLLMVQSWVFYVEINTIGCPEIIYTLL
jgi:hypothetical protein